LEIRISELSKREPQARLYRKNRAVAKVVVEIAVADILELSVDFEDLGVQAGDPIQMYVEAAAKKQSVDRAPHEGSLVMSVPSPDFELIMWQA
jgi:hypothetical protein